MSLCAFAQGPINTPIYQTALSEGIVATDTLASITGNVFNTPSAQTPLMFLIEQEAVLVTSLQNTGTSPANPIGTIQYSIKRAQLGTTAVRHNPGAVLWSGYPSQFGTTDKSGSCNPAPQSPQFVNVAGLRLWTCVAGTWTSTSTHVTGGVIPFTMNLIAGDGLGNGADSGIAPTNVGTVKSFAAPSGSWPTWLVPAVTSPTVNPSLAVAATVPGVLSGSGVDVTGSFPSQTASSSYTAPGSGTTKISQTNYDTSIGVPVSSFGVVCDAVQTLSTGLITGTDDGPKLQAMFDALGSNGITKIVFPAVVNNGTTIAGRCKTNQALTLGNGSASAWSTINGISIQGAGGTQTTTISGGLTIGSGTGNYITPQAGSSIVYAGAALGTTPVLTVAGPIRNLALQGFSVDCRYLSQTCIYINSMAQSHVKDVMALNNLPGTNIWNAGFWLSSYSSSPSTGDYSGSQNNVFEQWGAQAFLVNNPTASLIMIGCPDAGGTTCPGVANGLDVSGNKFDQTIALDYTGGGHGIVLGFEDSNVFTNLFVASYNLYYLLNLSNGFPGGTQLIGPVMTSSPLFMNTWTLTQNINSTDFNPVFTTSVGAGSSTPLAGGFLGIGEEIMQISAVSVISGGFQITGARIPQGHVATTHSSGAAISGPNGYAIDGTTCSSAGNTSIAPNKLFITGGLTAFGVIPNSGLDNQLSAIGVCGTTGTTVTGLKFNSPIQSGGSVAFNPLINSQLGFYAPINAVSAGTGVPVYVPSWTRTVPAAQIGDLSGTSPIGQGVVVHLRGLMNVTNTSGSTGVFKFALKTTDNTGSTVWNDPVGQSYTTGQSGLVHFDIAMKFFYNDSSNPILGSYKVYGPVQYLNSSNADVDALLPFTGGTLPVLNHDLSSGMTIDIGGSFSVANTNFNVVISDASLYSESPDYSGLF